MGVNSSKKIIQVEGLVKKYGKLVAVNEISFEVKEGEIFGLLGQNGAGKTTTLEIMETLRPKDFGKVTICGFDLDKNPKGIKNVIGVQLQQSGFYPRLNLVELIELFADMYGTKVDAKDLLKKFDLQEKATAEYNQLSGGQKQRFSICTTLIHRPKVVFLDEPSTGLDPHARRNLWKQIEEIRETGTTIIITTHYMDEAEFLCDRVAIIDSGKIIAIDSPESLIDKLVESGFQRPKQVKKASLEDVFLNLTGKELSNE